MRTTRKEYALWCRRACPPSPLLKDCLWAFGTGGGICLLGEGLRVGYAALGCTLTAASTLTSLSLIFLSALFTGLGLYQKLAAKAGAGTLVPITGCANAVVSPAIEFKEEGFITGVGAKLFLIAGPVIVYGVAASSLWGLVWYVLRPWVG